MITEMEALISLTKSQLRITVIFFQINWARKGVLYLLSLFNIEKN